MIATIAPSKLDAALRIAQETDSVVLQIGEVQAGGRDVLLSRKGNLQVAPRLESERFAEDSWFGKGIEAYVNLLLSVDLP